MRVCEQVRDALMAPLRELQSATHFRQLTDGCWAPCKPSERGAKKLSLLEVPAQALRTPPVTHAHFDAAVERCRAPPAGTFSAVDAGCGRPDSSTCLAQPLSLPCSGVAPPWRRVSLPDTSSSHESSEPATRCDVVRGTFCDVCEGDTACSRNAHGAKGPQSARVTSAPPPMCA